MNHPRPIARRRFLGHSVGLAASSLLPLAGARASVPDGRALSFVHTHTHERIQLVYAVSDTYVPDALTSLNRFLRDHYSGEIGAIDPRLFDLLHQVQVLVGSARPFETNVLERAMLVVAGALVIIPAGQRRRDRRRPLRPRLRHPDAAPRTRGRPQMTERFAPAALMDLMRRALEKSGASPAMASATAAALVAAELDGIPSHGASRIPQYCGHVANGRATGSAVPRVARERGGACLVDAGGGLAFEACALAVREVISRARSHGVAFASVANSNHFGVAAFHAEPIAEAGLVGLAFGNSPAAMPAAGGRTPVFGTNPIAAVFPRRDGAPLSIDLSLSEVAARQADGCSQGGEADPARLGARPRRQPDDGPQGRARGLDAADGWRHSWKISPPVVIIAHSMGSLVSRYYVERLGGKKKVSRMIFLGGPHYGSPQALMTLLFGPKLLPFGLLGERLREVISTFPSMYQLLPIYPCAEDQKKQSIDLFSDDSWLLEEQRPLLRTAREFRKELGTHCGVPSVSIFGYGIKTITRVKVKRNPQGRWQNVDFEAEEGGDATVPEQSAIVEGSEIHPVQQAHGTLYVVRDVKKRLKLELTRPPKE